MKTALIIGSNGNFGTEMSIALQQAGWCIRAMLRDTAKINSHVAFDEVVQGDAMNRQDVESAAQGVDVIVYAANPPYHRWPELAMKTLEPTVLAAQALHLRILFPGNVYGLSPSNADINEQAAYAPATEKGLIRVQMEARLEEACRLGAKVTIVRAGDFIGPRMSFSWLEQIFKKTNSGVSMAIPHDDQHEHFWTFLPDLCANTARLLESSTADFEVWNDTGFALTAQHWQAAFAENSIPTKRKSFPWWMFKLLALFSPMLKEVMKMRYLWQERVVLDGTKMRAYLSAEFQQTSLADIVKQLNYSPAHQPAQAPVQVQQGRSHALNQVSAGK